MPSIAILHSLLSASFSKHAKEHLCIFTGTTFIEPTFFCGRLADAFFWQMVVILWETMNYFIKTVHSHNKIFMVLAETHIARQLTTQKHMLWSQLGKFPFSDFNGWIGICKQCIHFIYGHIRMSSLNFTFCTTSPTNYHYIFSTRGLAATLVAFIKCFY